MLKAAAAASFVLFAGWLVMAGAAAHVLGERFPAFALAIAPFDARSNAALAERIVVEGRGSRAALANARTKAEAALRRDATIVPAWRTLALAALASGDQRRTAHLFRLTERMSRRDLPTQLWLIEERVGQNDIAGALRHYDIALRTTPAAAEFLFPVLVGATADDGIIGPLAALLRTDPPWRQPFFFALAESAPHGPNALRLVGALAPAGMLPRDDILATLIDRVGRTRDFESAWRIYRLARPGPESGALVRNGGFTGAESFSPFEWWLNSGGDLSAAQITLEGAGDGTVLEVRGSGDNGGVVSQQVLMLPPGRYQLSSLSGPLEETRQADLSWRISCATEQGTAIAEVPLRPARGAAQVSAAWQVPATGCRAQWLVLAVRPGALSGNVGAWVDSVSIRRVPAG